MSLLAADADAVMGHVRRRHDHNARLNAAGITYNVWTSMARGCLRCGSAFEGHHCHVVGGPTEAHRLAQPLPEQEALW